MSATSSDPWHLVKSEITTTLGEVERLYASLRGLSAPAAVQRRQQIVSQLDSVELDLQDLSDTIGVVEKQRDKFQISDAELDSRRGFVHSTEAFIRTTRAELAQRGGGAPAAASSSSACDSHDDKDNEKAGLLSGADKPKGRRQQAAEVANEEMMAQHSQHTQIQMAEQEEVLDDLQGAVRQCRHVSRPSQSRLRDDERPCCDRQVTRLKSMGGQMSEELRHQDRMLGGLQEQMEHVSSAMGMLKSKMAQMARSSDRGKYCAILWLTVLLGVLTMLALS